MLVRVLAMASVCVLLLVSVSTTTTLHMFNGPFSGLPRWAGTRKVKPIWILLKQERVSGSGIKPICILLNQETVSGSGISWDVCKSAPLSRWITMLAPHHSVFYRPDALLPPDQQPQSTEGGCLKSVLYQKGWTDWSGFFCMEAFFNESYTVL